MMKRIFTLFFGLSLLLVSSVGWGQTYLIQEGFSTTSLPAGWSGDVYFNATANHGNLSGGNGAGFNANDKYLQTPAVNSPGILTFYLKGSSSTSQISLKVQKKVGEGAWEDVASFPKPHNTTSTQHTVILNDENDDISIKFVAYDRTGNSLYLDDIELTELVEGGVLLTNPSTVSDLNYEVDNGPSEPGTFALNGTGLDETDVILSAPTDFEVSLLENTDFGSSVTLTSYNGSETNIWVRLQAGKSAGDYSGNLEITGGGADAINVAVSGRVIPSGYFIDFEGDGETKGSYASGSVNLSGFEWNMTESLIGTIAGDWKNGDRSARMRGYGSSSITMLEDKIGGAGNVSFSYRRYGTDAQVDWKVEYSVNQGVEWKQLGSDFTAPATDEVQTFNEALNVPWDVRIRIKRATETGTSDYRLNIDDILVSDFEEPVATIFSGIGDWSESARWSEGIPGTGTNVTIQGEATVDVASTINNITISDGGSLIDNSNLTINGDFTMQRTIANDNGWHLLSSPASGLTIIGSDFVPAAAGDPAVLPTNFDFYSFLEGENELVWNNIRSEVNTPNGGFDANFVNGKGYLVAYADGYGTTSFDLTGTLNTGDINSPILTYTGGGQQGWNLIGNPYPSAINWNTATRTQFNDQNAYIYDENKVGGAGWVSTTGLIAPNQGFFVELNSANNGDAFQFTNAIREHGGSFLKSQDFADQMTIRFGNEANFDEASFRLLAEAEYNRDWYDARKLYSMDAGIPQVYSLSDDNVKLSINYIPEINEEAMIPLGFKVASEGIYELSLVDLAGAFEGQTVFLKDNANGVQQNLNENSTYSFSATAEDNPNRFLIHFGALSIDESSLTTAASAYVHNSTLYVLNASGQTQVDIIDLQGRKLQSSSFRAEGLYSQPISLPTGVYVVRVMDEKGVRTAKVVVE